MKIKLFALFLWYLLIFYSSIYPQWKQQTNGLQMWNLGEAISTCNNNTAIIAVDSIIYKTVDAGDRWEKISYPLYGFGFDVSIIDKEHFWIGTDAGAILATSDGGKNWLIQFYDTTMTQFIDYIKLFDSNNGIAIGDAVRDNPFLFLVTKNGGKNWLPVNYSSFQGGFSGDVWRRICFINQDVGYFYISGITPNQQLYKTTDSGKNWLLTNFPNPYADLIKFYNENIGLVFYMQTPLPDLKYRIGRTTDGGNSWESFNLNSIDNPDDIEFIPGHPDEVWYVDLGSLYFSSDTGRIWTKQKIYNGNLNGRDIVFTDSTHGWLLCDSGRVFHTSNNGGIITSIPLNNDNIPSGFNLIQNYPNPFNPSTTIKYIIPKESNVTIKIFNVLGRKVLTLLNAEQQGGEYEIDWNAKGCASGIYFYQICAGNFISTKKMLLLK